jgi:16S rRNA (cytosine1402-N4)-methyltransferase
MPYKHVSVMPAEVLDCLNCRPGKIYVDCTLGGSGHAGAIAEKIIPDGLLIGMDQDKAAIQNAKNVLKPYEKNIRLFHDNFINLPQILPQLNIPAVDGILLDLGLSLYQLEGSGRGFSFKKDEPLDMRMDIRAGKTAEDLINTMGDRELAKIFWEYGEERWARQIARKIVKERMHQPIRSSKRLAQIVWDAVPAKALFARKIHPATRVFMALRIAVNKELERLASFMEIAPDLLNPKGRICVLSFHSLEDRIVKHRIRELEKECTCPPSFPICVCKTKRVLRSLTRKALKPTEQEIRANPMARSARLRGAEKI